MLKIKTSLLNTNMTLIYKCYLYYTQFKVKDTKCYNQLYNETLYL